MMVNQVTINFNMFRALMKNIIMGNLNDTSIITINVYSFGFEELPYPLITIEAKVVQK